MKLLLLPILLMITLTSCSKSPEDVLKRYCKAKDVEGRISCVIQDPEVIRLMKKRYDKDWFQGQKEIYWKDFHFETLEIESGKFIDRAHATRYDKSTPDYSESFTYVLVKDEFGDYLIDWKASMGIGDLTIPQYLIKMPKESTKLYAYAKMDNYYNYEFRSSSDYYQSISLTGGSYGGTVYGYAKRGTSTFDKLSVLLQDGDKLPVTVMVSFSNQASSSGNVVLIDELLHEHWGEPTGRLD